MGRVITYRRLRAVIPLATFVLAGQLFHWWQPLSHKVVAAQPGLYKVVADIDGDTIIVDMNGTEEKVRFIGVDTPETHDPRKGIQCYGPTAAAFTKSVVTGTVVRLESDSMSTNRDRYGRLLRYIFTQDGTLLNQMLITRGYGFAYTGFPFSKKVQFLAAEAGAQNDRLGLWGTCHPTHNQFGGYTSNDAVPP